MPLLFSYGTLQRDEVQRATFGRRLAGQDDALVGYASSRVPIDDPEVAARLGTTHHANVAFTGDDSDRVPGMAFEIADAELTSVDGYEAPFSYVRVSARLASGRQTWVYVHTEQTSPRPTVRLLTPDDAPAWAALRREALEGHPLAFGSWVPDAPAELASRIRERMLDQETAVFGAVDAERLVGTVGVQRESGRKERHKAFVWGMYVTAGHRQQGTGQALLRAAIAQARSWRGVDHVHLTVTGVAGAGRRLYERHGFQAWGVAPRALLWDGLSTDETHMILDLRG